MKRWQMFFHASFAKCGQDYSSIVHGTASTRIDQQRIPFHSSFLGPIPWTLPAGTDCSSKILYRHWACCYSVGAARNFYTVARCLVEIYLLENVFNIFSVLHKKYHMSTTCRKISSSTPTTSHHGAHNEAAVDFQPLEHRWQWDCWCCSSRRRSSLLYCCTFFEFHANKYVNTSR